jgi:cytochrome P450
MVNHVLHHDPQKWGDDHDQFTPERWLSGKISPNDIMPFGTGHRACIGRNIANINILKVFTTLWRNFQFEPEAKNEVLQIESVGIGEKKGPLFCKAQRREE